MVMCYSLLSFKTLSRAVLYCSSLITPISLICFSSEIFASNDWLFLGATLSGLRQRYVISKPIVAKQSNPYTTDPFHLIFQV